VGEGSFRLTAGVGQRATPVFAEGRHEMARHDSDHEVSSGNVLADLELPASDELLAKAELARQITSIATHRHLTQAETAGVLGTTQPKVSDLFVAAGVSCAGGPQERQDQALPDLREQLAQAPARSSGPSPSFPASSLPTTMPSAVCAERSSTARSPSGDPIPLLA